MPPFTNLSFETAGATPGSALGWTLASLATALETATYFLDAVPTETTREGFEGGWSSNESYSFALGSSTAAAYDTAAQAFEDF
jgi:hypothetical protein